MHHKYVDTNADPYSSARGVFFSHIGWIFVEKHPDVIKKGKGIDMSDMENDKIVRFQERYTFLYYLKFKCAIIVRFWVYLRHFYVLRAIFAFIIPTLLISFLGEYSG